MPHFETIYGAYLVLFSGETKDLFQMDPSRAVYPLAILPTSETSHYEVLGIVIPRTAQIGRYFYWLFHLRALFTVESVLLHWLSNQTSERSHLSASHLRTRLSDILRVLLCSHDSTVRSWDRSSAGACLLLVSATQLRSTHLISTGSFSTTRCHKHSVAYWLAMLMLGQ